MRPLLQLEHSSFDAECRCPECRMGPSWQERLAAPVRWWKLIAPAARQPKGFYTMPSCLQGKAAGMQAWHRTGWSGRKQRHKDYPLCEPASSAPPGGNAWLCPCSLLI